MVANAIVGHEANDNYSTTWEIKELAGTKQVKCGVRGRLYKQKVVEDAHA